MSFLHTSTALPVGNAVGKQAGAHSILDTTGCPRTHSGANDKCKSMAEILRGGKGG